MVLANRITAYCTVTGLISIYINDTWKTVKIKNFIIIFRYIINCSGLGYVGWLRMFWASFYVFHVSINQSNNWIVSVSSFLRFNWNQIKQDNVVYHFLDTQWQYLLWAHYKIIHLQKSNSLLIQFLLELEGNSMKNDFIWN